MSTAVGSRPETGVAPVLQDHAPVATAVLRRSLPGVLQRVRRATGATVAFAGTVGQGSSLRLDHVDGLTRGVLAGVESALGEGVGGTVVATRCPLDVADYPDDPRITHRYDHVAQAEGIRAVAAAPIVLLDLPVAVLYAAHHVAGEVGDQVKNTLATEARGLEQRILIAEAMSAARRDAPADPSSAEHRLLQERTRTAYRELRAIAAQVGAPEIRHALLRTAQALALDSGASTVPTPDCALTERERDLLSWVAVGQTNAQIAAGLGITVNTVKSYMKAILRKLDAANRVEAVVLARRTNQIP